MYAGTTPVNRLGGRAGYSSLLLGRGWATELQLPRVGQPRPSRLTPTPPLPFSRTPLPLLSRVSGFIYSSLRPMNQDVLLFALVFQASPVTLDMESMNVFLSWVRRVYRTSQHIRHVTALGVHLNRKAKWEAKIACSSTREHFPLVCFRNDGVFVLGPCVLVTSGALSLLFGCKYSSPANTWGLGSEA